MPDTPAISTPDIPAVPLTPGNQTSEYAMSNNVQTVTSIVTVLGTVAALAEPVISRSPNTKWSIIGGALIGVIGIITKLLVALGYTHSRTAQKLNQ